jgi:integrase
MPRKLPHPADPLLREFASSRRNLWSVENVYNALGVLNRLHAWLTERDLTLTTATPGDLNDFLAFRLASTGRRGEPLTAATVQVDHRQMKSFYAWASADPDGMGGYVDRNPMRGNLVPAPKQDEDPAPDNVPEAEEWQYRALLETCKRRQVRAGGKHVNDRRDAAMIALLWHCGMRRSELVRITYGDIDFDTQMIHLGRTKGRSTTKSRDVWVDDEAMDLLSRFVFHRGHHDGPLFESTGRVPGTTQRRPLAPNSVTLMLRRRTALANATQRLPEPLSVPSHAFRRGAAVAWLDAGAAQVTLETNMGWKHDGRMAARYTRKASTALAASDARKVAASRRTRNLRSVG